MEPREKCRKGGLLWVALSAMVVAGCAQQSLVSSSEQRECRRVALDPAPRWTFSGLWTENGEVLVLADVLAGRLLRYDRDGSHIGSIARPGKGPLEFDRPVELLDAGNEIILISRTDHILGLSAKLEPEWDVRLPDLDLSGPETVVSVKSTVASGHKQVVGMLGIRDSEKGSFWLGFGRLTLGKPSGVERLQPIPDRGTPVGEVYSMIRPLVAKAGVSVYALQFEGGTHIQQLLPSLQKLAAFPPGYERAPAIPRSGGPSTDASRFHAVEMATMPVALYGSGELLYLLTRESRAEGGTRWMLHQIDPEKDRLLRSLSLPTQASHVFLVPGPVEWAVVEKGPVISSGEQQIGTVIFIPASRIEDPMAQDPSEDVPGTLCGEI